MLVHDKRSDFIHLLYRYRLAGADLSRDPTLRGSGVSHLLISLPSTKRSSKCNVIIRYLWGMILRTLNLFVAKTVLSGATLTAVYTLSASLISASTLNFSVTNLGTLGGSASTAQGINNSGQLVGYSVTAGGTTHGFLYTGGAMIDLGTLAGDPNSEAYGINNLGQIVGTSGSADLGNGVQHAFIYQSGTMSYLGNLGGQSSLAEGINDSGQVTGYSAVGGSLLPRHAFLYSNGTMTDLGTLAKGQPQGCGWPTIYRGAVRERAPEERQVLVRIAKWLGRTFLAPQRKLQEIGSPATSSRGPSLHLPEVSE